MPPQQVQRLVGGVQDGPLRRQMLQGPAHLQNGADLLLSQRAALVLHDGDEGAQIPPAAVVGHAGALPGADLQKPLAGQFGKAAVYHCAAHLHLLGQHPLRGQLGAHRQRPRQDHTLELLYKQVLQAGGGQLGKFHVKTSSGSGHTTVQKKSLSYKTYKSKEEKL